jgi:hypothetical protein
VRLPGGGCSSPAKVRKMDTCARRSAAAAAAAQSSSLQSAGTHKRTERECRGDWVAESEEKSWAAGSRLDTPDLGATAPFWTRLANINYCNLLYLENHILYEYKLL